MVCGRLPSLHPEVPVRGDGEPADEYAFRLMPTVMREQLRSFLQMIDTTKEISDKTRRSRDDWEETDDSDESNYQDSQERVRIKRLRKRIQVPIFKGTVEEYPEHRRGNKEMIRVCFHWGFIKILQSYNTVRHQMMKVPNT